MNTKRRTLITNGFCFWNYLWYNWIYICISGVYDYWDIEQKRTRAIFTTSFSSFIFCYRYMAYISFNYYNTKFEQKKINSMGITLIIYLIIGALMGTYYFIKSNLQIGETVVVVLFWPLVILIYILVLLYCLFVVIKYCINSHQSFRKALKEVLDKVFKP